MVEPGGLLSVGLHRVGHDWSDLAAVAAKMRSRIKSAKTRLGADCVSDHELLIANSDLN